MKLLIAEDVFLRGYMKPCETPAGDGKRTVKKKMLQCFFSSFNADSTII